jgi:hypothetical protein
MYHAIVKPTPVHIQNNLQHILKHNAYRFVFYCYGTTQIHEPHYALYSSSWNTCASIYLSDYILYSNGPAAVPEVIHHNPESAPLLRPRRITHAKETL